ncbi:phospholipid transporting ATPase [Lobulomyces angularis]|nr:phospholipid transporting ATPase [Lobulomyces angularis]
MNNAVTEPALKADSSLNSRRVYVNIEPHDTSSLKQVFKSNEVHTSKYKIWNFIPKTLFEQFRRVANLFFLSLVIIQCFPEYQTVNPFLAACPLAIIVLLTAAKDATEDFKRHRTDNLINHQITKTVKGLKNENIPFFEQKSKNKKKNTNKISPEFKRPSTTELNWEDTFWKDVQVGDFIRLGNNEAIPADIFLMATSDPDCLCYVETKNLDGETNLKIMRGVVETSFISTTGECAKFGCFIDTEVPTPNLYSFSGKLTIPKDYIKYVAEKTARYGIECSEIEYSHTMQGSVESVCYVEKEVNNTTEEKSSNNFTQVPININNLLLRGCFVRNTDWVIGMVVATGDDTKIRLNSGDTPSKRSFIEKKMNEHISYNLCLLALLCVITSTASPLWEAAYFSFTQFTESNINSAKSSGWWLWFQSFLQSLITYQNIVPISLYLTVEIVKTFQAYFIYSDIEMYSAELNAPCVPRSWNLADDLGQIEYIFSDKTGTLTRNIMEFKKCSINGVIYEEDRQPESSKEFQIKKDSSNNFGKSLNSNTTLLEDSEEKKLNKFKNAKLSKSMAIITDPQHAPAHKFFTALAVCHSVLLASNPDIEKIVDPEKNDFDSLVYQASSPDEAALVKAARDLKFVFVGREGDVLIVNILGIEQRFRILNVIEFNSTRKRMSVIAKCPDGQIRVFCKGADSVIYERLGDSQNDKKIITTKHMDLFGREGLRTLCLSSVVLTEQEYEKWDQEYQIASVSLADREEMIDAVAEKIERNLNLLGATAIEDRLQEKVPEAIHTLSNAGIKIWVLTGDKVETAINIGFSCNLLKKDMNIILLKAPQLNSKDGKNISVKDQIEMALKKYWGIKLRYSASSPLPEIEYLSNFETSSPKNALVIDGVALKHALESKEDGHLFWLLSTRCEAVLCCRVSPLQKANVVELVKVSGKGAMCLAIGDGANDVGMIQAAHIGIGIAGEEGLQAVMASDYAIAQFHYLTRLLLVHGHWSYYKTSEMILGFFFKNLIFVMPLFWYQLLCGFSSEMIFEFSYMLLYNLIFTSTPVAALGIFEQDISSKISFLIPTIYLYGIKMEAFTNKRFFLFMLEGFYQSLICFGVSILSFNEQPINSSGNSQINFELGAVMSIVTIWNANFFFFFNTHSKSWPIFVAVFGSNLTLLGWTALYSQFRDSNLFQIGSNLLIYPSFYLILLLSTALCLLPRMTIAFAHQSFHPTDIQIIQELEKFSQKNIEDEIQAYHTSSAISLYSKKSSTFSFGKSKQDLLPTTDIQKSSLQFSEDSLLVPNQKSHSEHDFFDNSDIDEIQIEEQNSLLHSVFDNTPIIQSNRITHQYAYSNNARVHFNEKTSSPHIPTQILSEESDSCIPFPSSNNYIKRSESSISNSSIHLNVMQGRGFDARGFSFSESPGVRDLILGRKDVRLSPLLLDESKNFSVSNSTQSVPGNIRPRANTFTYNKRWRHSLNNIHEKKTYDNFRSSLNNLPLPDRKSHFL